jgi:hypothetical protein
MCPTKDANKNPCNKCSDMYAVVELLQEKHKIANAQPNYRVTRAMTAEQCRVPGAEVS